MDDLLKDFLTEAFEGLAELDTDLVRFESQPNDADLLSNIFRTVHTIKGTCGFIGLPRLEALAHSAENVLGRFRDGELTVTGDRVSLILESVDQIKAILVHLDHHQEEPSGDDGDLIARLDSVAESDDDSAAPDSGTPSAHADRGAESDPAPSPVDTAPSLEEPAWPATDEPWHGDNFYGTSAEELTKVSDIPAGANDQAPAAPAPSVPELAPPAAARAETAEASAEAPASPDASATVAAQSIRVSVDLLENLMTMVSELVLTRNQLLQIARTDQENELSVPLQRLSQVTSELQEGVMKTRMQPIGNGWSKLPRLVRDLTRELGKRVELSMTGAETELDRQVLELIRDPLTHMVRNSVDHGIESPSDRLAAGKPEVGRIRLNAFHEGGHIIIELADDGRGLVAEKIKAKAIAKGLVSETDVQSMSEAQLQQLIFKPGFSTAEAVTSVSGRGVGMDVVRTNVEKIGGTIEVKSVPGKGTKMTIKIPLTLAIVSALIVAAGGERFAIPQISVIELVRATGNSEHRIERIQGAPVLRLRDRLLPLVSLRRMLALDDGEPPVEEGRREDFVVVTQVGNYRYGLLVDSVFDTEEIVVKPVAPILRDISVFSGNTILGDGSVIMILDPNGIASETGEIRVNDDRLAGADETDVVVDSEESTFLLFSAAGGRRAVPLSLVARIEQIDMATVERATGRPVLQYRGQLMPLITLDGQADLTSEGERPMLVFSEGGRSMGLLVDEIIDIVESKVSIELTSETKGLIGNAVIAGKATDIVDVGHYLAVASDDWFGTHGNRRRNRRGTTRSVLLVDDSGFFRSLVQPLLTSAGFSVTAVPSGAQALELCEAGRDFDVIVTDIEMPEMNGFEFARNVKETRWADVPLVALTSNTTAESIQQGRTCGFVDYIAKLDRSELIDALEQIAA